jgi:monoamine oxidase
MLVKVAIIGAGAAGLKTASKLLDKGLVTVDEMVILEARGRIGGRIHTTQEHIQPCLSHQPPMAVYRDHGAAWVHGIGCDWALATTTAGVPSLPNPMMQLLNVKQLQPIFELGNPWVRPGHVLIRPKKIMLFVNGKAIDATDDIMLDALQRHREIMKKVGTIGYQLVCNGQTQETVEQSFQQAIDQVLLEENSLATQDASSDLTTELIAGFYRHLIQCWHGTSASGLQLNEFTTWIDQDDDQEYRDEGDFVGPHCTVQKGMYSLLEPMVQKVSPCIKLNQPVTSVRQQEGKPFCAIETASGMVVQADYCVVTVSLGCLAHSLTKNDPEPAGKIDFSPALSPEKIDAIQHMQMGSYKKVYMEFDRIFWPKHEPLLGLIRSDGTGDDELGNHMLLDNLWARDDIPCLEAILFGNTGRWATGKSDNVIRDAVLGFLAHTMGMDQLQEWCVGCHITRWEEDPYSRGAYSGYRLGTLSEHTEALSTCEWNGRLRFGGEATLSGHEGSIHAALISGENVANQLAEAMRETSGRS